jgi:pyruvate dehydrogenase E1 component
VAALKALADENKVPSSKIVEAITKFGINPEKPSPARA